MNTAQSHYPGEAARKHLIASLNALASDDCAKCSQHLWLAARQAAAAVAKRRDWPADTDAEIKDAVRYSGFDQTTTESVQRRDVSRYASVPISTGALPVGSHVVDNFVLDVRRDRAF